MKHVFPVMCACAALTIAAEARGHLKRRRDKDGLFVSAPTAPGGGLLCVKWRKTLNCNPSGPRDPVQDKDCTVTIPGTEAGFCECEGYVHTAASPCGHGPINCEVECGKVTKLVREVFGASYDPGAATGAAGAPAFAAGADPYDRARLYGDKAVKSVNEAVGAARQGLQAAKDMMARMMSLKPWHEIASAGKQAEDAGAKAQEMAKMARPFIYTQSKP